MAEGLALVLGRWLDRPGWGMVRRRVGGYLAEVRAAIPEPPRLRLETPSGTLLAAVEYVEGETVFECVTRTHPGRGIMLCGADMTPLDPAEPVGDVGVLVVAMWQGTTSVADLIRNNSLGELRWALAGGRRWSRNAVYWAAEGGHLELLQWALANGCRWTPDTISGAALNGHLSLVQWAIRNGGAYSSITSYQAAINGHLELLQWVLANGCPLHPDTGKIARTRGYTEIVEWLGGRA